MLTVTKRCRISDSVLFKKGRHKYKFLPTTVHNNNEIVRGIRYLVKKVVKALEGNGLLVSGSYESIRSELNFFYCNDVDFLSVQMNPSHIIRGQFFSWLKLPLPLARVYVHVVMERKVVNRMHLAHQLKHTHTHTKLHSIWKTCSQDVFEVHCTSSSYHVRKWCASWST